MTKYSEKNSATISVLGEVSINETFLAGRVYSVKPSGHIASATTNPNYTTRFYLYGEDLAGRQNSDDAAGVFDFDFPVYVSDSPSDHRVNPALINAVCKLIEDAGQ
jgi:hypothetical protein